MRLLLLLYITICASGCAVATAVSAIPSALYSTVADQFSGDEESFPNSMRSTLATLQESLQIMQLNIDVLEIQPDGGYGIAFNTDKLTGEITLVKQTDRLTTVYVQVKESMTRQPSVERAIIEMMKERLNNLDQDSHIDLASFHILHAKAAAESERMGWIRPGARVGAFNSGSANWMRIKMPSGKSAYFNNAVQ